MDENLNARADALSVLGWWQLAGVDTLIDETPRDWLRPPNKTPPAPAVGNAPTALPATLQALCDWLGCDRDAAPANAPRVLPSGSLESGLMLMCAQPEIDERETLFAGPPGKLLDSMLAAIGLSRPAVYLSSISPAHLPRRDPAAAEGALVRMARHHIGLAAPRALLVVGDVAAQLLLGGGVAATRGRLHRINHFGGTVAAVSTFHPRLLLTTPARKADAWRDLRLLLEELGR